MKIRKWFKEYDSSETYQRTFLNMIRQGKSLKQLQAILNSYGMEKVSTDSVRRFINSLDPSITELWRSQRPRNRILGKLRKKLNPEKARKQFIDENVKLCPHCSRIIESTNLYIRPIREMDFQKECIVEKCRFCKGVLGYVDSPNVVTAEQWAKEERKQRSIELYGI